MLYCMQVTPSPLILIHPVFSLTQQIFHLHLHSSGWPWRGSWSWRRLAAAAGRPWGGSWTHTAWQGQKRHRMRRAFLEDGVGLVNKTREVKGPNANKTQKGTTKTSIQPLIRPLDRQYVDLEGEDAVTRKSCHRANIFCKNMSVTRKQDHRQLI